MSTQTIDDIYSCTPRKTREYIVDCIEAGLVPFVEASPGVGKSSLYRSVNEQFNLAMVDHRLSTSAPEDLSGLPYFKDGIASFLPFDIFPLEDTPLPAGKDGWMIFLDEFNHAAKMVQAASYKLILDKMVGQRKIHPRSVICLAGNLITDRAFVNPLSTALQSRVVTIHMIPDLREWTLDVAIPQQYDERIISYVNYKGIDTLMDFRPDHKNKTFCCPRTWEFMNNFVKGKVFNMGVDDEGKPTYEMESKTGLYGGTITSGVAVDFVQFTKVFHELIKIDEIVRDPLNTPLPTTKQGNFALITHLGAKTDVETFAKVSQYVNRMEIIYQILFFRMIKHNLPTIRHAPAFAQALINITQYLNED